MIFCQSCLTKNPPDSEFCGKCGQKLLVLGGNQYWEEPEVSRISMEDHFLERISHLEETVNHLLEHLSRISETMEILDRNSFVTRSGLTSLVDTLRETNLLREELLYQRWETTMIEQMEEARYRDRFTQMKSRFLALFRGKPSKKNRFSSLIEEAEFLIFSDRFQESAELLEQGLRLDKKNYELAFYLGELYQQQGLSKEAARFLELALHANPDHGDSLLILALLHYGEDQTDEAERLLKHCIEVNPNNAVALLSMGSIMTAQQRYQEAKPLLESVNELDPQAQSYYLLGSAAKEQGRLKEAIDYLSYACELDPNHEDSFFSLGMAYLERGWTRKAKTCFSRAMELKPSKIEYEEAAQAATSVDETNSADLDTESLETLQFADSLVRKGKFKQALPHFRQLLKRYPSHYILLSSLSVLHFSLRRYEETLKVVRKIQAQQQVPEMVRCVAFTLQMESLRALGRYEEAIDALSEMLESFPEGQGRVIANYGLAMTKADMSQDLRQAETLAEEALSLSPPEFRHNVLDALGWVYFKQGRYEEALQLLESVVSMHENVNHLYHYGMVLLALNLKEEAFKAFERTVALRDKTEKVEDFIFSAIRREMDLASESQDPR